MQIRRRSIHWGISLTLATAVLLSGNVAGVAEAAKPAIKVTVYCYSNPERVVIRNNRSKALTIRNVGSIYQPYSSEPFYVRYRLGAGKTVTFKSGYGASASSSKTLTRQYIFNNDVGSREGARVRLSNGVAYVDRCG